MKEVYDKNLNVVSSAELYDRCFEGVKTSQVNLLIDEFMYVDKAKLNLCLDYDWKTVTMVSSLN